MQEPVDYSKWQADVELKDPDRYINDLVHPGFGCSISLCLRTDARAKALVEKYGSVYLGNYPKTPTINN